MSEFIIQDLSALPDPTVIEELEYLEIYKAKLASFLGFNPEYEQLLASDPAIKLVEFFAYEEFILRQRVNNAARSNLLAFATGADLDQLGAFYGVERLTGETDEAYKLRIQTRIIGWANAGGAAHYTYWAKTVSSDIQDVRVSSPTPGAVQIAILATTGVPDGALLAAIDAVVQADDVRVLTDTVTVIAGTEIIQNVSVDVRLLPATPIDIFDTQRDTFSSTILTNRALGWDLTTSWIEAHFQVPGVYDVVVTNPAANVVVGVDEFVTIGTLTATMVGRTE